MSLRNVADLNFSSVTSTEVTVGSGVSIGALMDVFETAKVQTGFEYLGEIQSLWHHTASTGVRNVSFDWDES